MKIKIKRKISLFVGVVFSFLLIVSCKEQLNMVSSLELSEGLSLKLYEGKGNYFVSSYYHSREVSIEPIRFGPYIDQKNVTIRKVEFLISRVTNGNFEVIINVDCTTFFTNQKQQEYTVFLDNETNEILQRSVNFTIILEKQGKIIDSFNELDKKIGNRVF